MKYAANKDHIEKIKELRNISETDDKAALEQQKHKEEEQKITEQLLSLNLEEKDVAIRAIPIAKFKPNQIQMMDGKLQKNLTINTIEAEEVKESGPTSPIRF